MINLQRGIGWQRADIWYTHMRSKDQSSGTTSVWCCLKNITFWPRCKGAGQGGVRVGISVNFPIQYWRRAIRKRALVALVAQPSCMFRRNCRKKKMSCRRRNKFSTRRRKNFWRRRRWRRKWKRSWKRQTRPSSRREWNGVLDSDAEQDEEWGRGRGKRLQMNHLRSYRRFSNESGQSSLSNHRPIIRDQGHQREYVQLWTRRYGYQPWLTKCLRGLRPDQRRWLLEQPG